MIQVNNIVGFSDTHCGDSLGLHPDWTIYGDGGRPTSPTRLQKALWSMWREFWDDHVPSWVRGQKWTAVHNGDGIDGVHHGSVTQLTHNLTDQRRIAYECLKPIADAARASGGEYYHIRGTEAHVGKSGAEEEALARELGAVPDEDGNHARWELWIRVGKSPGKLCHFTHHIGTTSSAAYESTAVHSEWVKMQTQASEDGTEPPQVVVRSHRHRHFETKKHFRGEYGYSIVTPCWQLRTPFSFRGAGRAMLPHFGGILVRMGDRELHTRSKVWTPQRSKEA